MTVENKENKGKPWGLLPPAVRRHACSCQWSRPGCRSARWVVTPFMLPRTLYNGYWPIMHEGLE